MAKKKKLLSSDPKLRKKQLREAALREAASKKAKEAKVAAVREPVAVTNGEVVSKTSGETVKNTTIMGTADVKEAVKEVIMNNSTDSSRIEELISRSAKNLNKRQRKETDADLINAMQSNDMKVLAELLIEMRNKDERKLRYTRFQAWLATFTSLLALIVVCFVGFAVVRILPQINQIVDQANQIIAQANEVIAQASDTIEIANGAIVTANDAIVQANDAIVQVNGMLNDIQPAIDNLNKVTQDLADADINGMLKDVDKLVTSSEKNLGEALQTITDIDIKSLNESIADLNAVVKPLASMFRR